MTKQQLQDLGLNEEQIVEVLKLATSYNDTRSHAPIYDNGVIVAKYCSRHKRYEPIDTFPKNSRAKDGYYSHCRHAESHLKKVTREIDKLKSQAFNEDVDIKALKKQVQELEASKYEFDDSGFAKDELKLIAEYNK